MRISELEVLMGEKPKTFDEKMDEGKSMHDGLGGAMKLREPHEKPYMQRTHYGARSDDHDTGY